MENLSTDKNNKTIRIAGFNKNSIVDGKGIRYTVYVQGCSHNCKGCHNPETHDFNGGTEIPIENIVSDIKKNKYLKGVTLSGGDPFFQPIAAKEIADRVHALGKDVWCYTGYTLEEILDSNDKDKIALLKSIDILVDGRFIQSQKTLTESFRGSSNQRLIRVKETLERNEIVIEPNE